MINNFNINFFEEIIHKHILITYNKSNISNDINYISFFWHQDKPTSGNFIFFAIKGNNLDGNDFISNAINNNYQVIVSDNLDKIKMYEKLYSHIYFIVLVMNFIHLIFQYKIH